MVLFLSKLFGDSNPGWFFNFSYFFTALKNSWTLFAIDSFCSSFDAFQNSLIVCPHNSTKMIERKIMMIWVRIIVIDWGCSSWVSSSQTVHLGFLYFTFHFYFYFYFHSVLFCYFLFLEQLGLGLICHAVTSVTTWWHSHKTDHETWENLVEDSRTNDIIQHGHHMLTS